MMENVKIEKKSLIKKEDIPIFGMFLIFIGLLYPMWINNHFLAVIYSIIIVIVGISALLKIPYSTHGKILDLFFSICISFIIHLSIMLSISEFYNKIILAFIAFISVIILISIANWFYENKKYNLLYILQAFLLLSFTYFSFNVINFSNYTIFVSSDSQEVKVLKKGETFLHTDFDTKVLTYNVSEIETISYKKNDNVEVKLSAKLISEDKFSLDDMKRFVSFDFSELNQFLIDSSNNQKEEILVYIESEFPNLDIAVDKVIFYPEPVKPIVWN